MKKLLIIIALFSFSVLPLSSQIRLQVEGDGQVSGDFEIGQSVVFGDSLIGPGIKLLWNYERGAFRFGRLLEDIETTELEAKNWDFDSIGLYSFSGGFNTKALGDHSFVGAGGYNKASGASSFVGAGTRNDASGSSSFVGAGTRNDASGSSSVIVGGIQNRALSSGSFVGGGRGNLAADEFSYIGGGESNKTADVAAFVGAGTNNRAEDIGSFVGAGDNNAAYGSFSFIGAGSNNQTSSGSSFVGGGANNQASGIYSIIVGGGENAATRDYTSVSGGLRNTASGSFSTVGGGVENGASGYASFIGGGVGLLAPSYGEVALGLYNQDYTPGSSNSFSSSDQIFAIGNGTDNNNRSNALTVLKNGHVGIGTTTPAGQLDVVGNIYQNSALIHSDLRFKENVLPISLAAKKIQELQGVSYTFKRSAFEERGFSEGRHLGLIAQEVETVFPELVFTDKQGFKAVNYDGLIPVIIEAFKEQDNKIKQLKGLEKDNEMLRKDNMVLQSRMDELEDLFNKMVAQIQGPISINSQTIQLRSEPELFQNWPNPFKGETIISYYLPETITKAQLHISAPNGRLLRLIDLTGRGHGQMTVQIQELPIGTYAYSLILDGQLFETRQMIIQH